MDLAVISVLMYSSDSLRKKITSAAALLILLSGCSDSYTPSGNLQPSLEAYYIYPDCVDFDSYYGDEFSYKFSIWSNDTPWKFADVADWISLSPNSGTTDADVNLTVAANPSGENGRTAIFYLKSDVASWSYSRAMSVSQGKAEPELAVENTEISVGGSASKVEVPIVANCSWESRCSESWVTLSGSVADGVLSVAVEANPSDTYRSAYVYIDYGVSKTIKLSVKQLPSSVSASAMTLEYENVASKYDVTIESEAEWTADVSDSWIQVSPSSGNAGSTTVSIEVSPNTSVMERSGFVTVSTGNNKRLTIKVKQIGLFIDADNRISFTSVVETGKLAIRSNTDWKIISMPEWISVSEESGNGNAELGITTSDNPNTTQRSGEIVIGRKDIDLQCIVNVVQYGKTLTTDVTLLDFSDKSGSQSFNLVSDASWTSSLSDVWFSATPMSGTGNSRIDVSVEENTSTDERNGTIKYLYLDKSVDVKVHQLAKYFTIDSKLFNFDSNGGKHTIDLSTNDSWTVDFGGASWLKLSQTSGNESAELTLTVEPNLTLNERSATISINSAHEQSIRLLVSQKGRYLSVSTQSIMLFSKGGTSEPVEIMTDGVYSIESDDEWFTVNKLEDNSFTVTMQPNQSNEARKGTITIKLTDLTEGELSLIMTVMQVCVGGTFLTVGFDEDSNWDSVSTGSLTVTVNGYTSDSNWDTSGSSGLTISIKNFDGDSDWNNSSPNTVPNGRQASRL